MIQQLSQSNFQEIINDNEVVLVDFYADWCGPCKALHPVLEALDVEFEGKAIISKINVDKNPELSQQFEVSSIPAIFYFKKGALVGKQVGLHSKSFLSDTLKNVIKNK